MKENNEVRNMKENNEDRNFSIYLSAVLYVLPQAPFEM